MKMNELITEKNFKQLTELELNSIEIQGLYYGDLLSWVMSHAKEKQAWVTVQTHVNIIAVASLLSLSCIIVPENISVDSDTIIKANSENIPIFSTDLDAYNIFKQFYELGMK